MASYTIKRDDTLGALARKNNTSVQELLKLNPTLQNPDLIYEGRSLSLPDAAPAAAPVSATPTAPVATGPANTANMAGQAGLGLNDLGSLLGTSPEEQTATRDKLAQDFGYGTYGDFEKEMFTKPSKTTQQFYEEAYRTAGLDKVLADITRRKEDLGRAEFATNDNPWLSEASRAGRNRRLQELANSDISNWEDLYKTGSERVRDLVAANAADIGADERLRESKFKYLNSKAEEAALSASQKRLADNLPSYLSGRSAAKEPEAPKTLTLPEGNAAYVWNTDTRSFDLVATRPKTYAPKGTPPPDTDTTVKAFRKSLAARAALDRAGTREQFIRELQAQYPNIEPADIARAVYETYPDSYNQR